MGTTKIDLTQMDLGRLQELRLKLEDPTNVTRTMGELRINATLWPRTQEDKEQVNIPPIYIHLNVQPSISTLGCRNLHLQFYILKSSYQITSPFYLQI